MLAGGNSAASVSILTNRDCSMYVNSYASSAKILTGQEAVRWYNKNFGTSWTITEYGGANSTGYHVTFSTKEPISVLENGSYYYTASAYSAASLYHVGPENRWIGWRDWGACRRTRSSFSKIWNPVRFWQWRWICKFTMENSGVLKQ